MALDSTAVDMGEAGSLLTVAEVAKRLAVSRAHVYRLLRTGSLRGVHLGSDWRVDASDLRAWIDERRLAPRG